MTKTELLTKIKALQIELLFKQSTVDQLQARLDLVAATCAYCGTTFWNDDPAVLDHWRTCEQHPARVELEEMRRSYHALEVQLNHASDRLVLQSQLLKALSGEGAE
jgi:hypothetical protein